MTDRLALDTNAVIEILRSPENDIPPPLVGRVSVLPLPTVGELYAGAFGSVRRDENVAVTEALVAKHTILNPDESTARLYGRLRAEFRSSKAALTTAKINDLWIAALCIQHDLPLLTNDRGFDPIPGLRVLHW